MGTMTITLNHTIAPAHSKREAARWFAQIFGLPCEDDAHGHFAAVRVNKDFTLLFADSGSFEGRHYAFHVDEREFDEILARVQGEGLPYGSAPWSRDDHKLNDWNGGRGVYFDSPDGHILELMTAPH
jgi:catechol 2,3-dioxygenase-like lactoylglutathione lyase family enzyme